MNKIKETLKTMLRGGLSIVVVALLAQVIGEVINYYAPIEDMPLMLEGFFALMGLACIGAFMWVFGQAAEEIMKEWKKSRKNQPLG